MHHLGYVPPPTIYQEFKRAHVARWAQGKPWAITSEQIDEWIAQSGSAHQLAEHLAVLKEDEELQRLTALEGDQAP